MRIIKYSIGRTGSTLITQVLKHLFPNADVRKTHSVVPPEKNVVVSYRDPRDVVVSQWRVHNNIKFAILNSDRKMFYTEMQKWTKFVLNTLNDMDVTIKNNPNALMLKYEDFYNDFGYLFDSLEKYFNIHISILKRAGISNDVSMDKNKDRQKKFSKFEEWDESGVHGLHIYTGEPGIWEKFIIDEHKEEFNNKLDKYLKELGYFD